MSVARAVNPFHNAPLRPARRGTGLRRGLAALVAVAVALLALCLPGSSLAEGAGDRPQGLMWNRSGLPAVFPLIVKTSPGRDYFMVLTSVETGEAALAAYIRGGTFFRVLTPPGTYGLRFHYGNGWLGEERLFGPGAQTRVYELPEPLTFRTLGLSRKAGHIVDLRGAIGKGDALASVAPVAICQNLDRRVDPDDIYLDLEEDETDRQDVRDLGQERPSLRHDPYATPDHDARSLLCDPRDGL